MNSIKLFLFKTSYMSSAHLRPDDDDDDDDDSVKIERR